MTGSSTPIASVVIPAHDEGSRIGATLQRLLDDVPPGSFEVVVVCNGCTDDTVDIARSVAGVRTLELAQAAKTAALQAGDEAATRFPRIYLDGDVGLSGAAVRALAETLVPPGPRVAGVRAQLDLSGSTWAVRRFFGFRQRLPVFQRGIIGAGVYALNEEGRASFGRWPEVLGDDQFVLRAFRPERRVLVVDHYSDVQAPSDLRAVIRRGIRVRRGNAQLDSGNAQLDSGNAQLDSGNAQLDSGNAPPLGPPPPTGLGRALREVLLEPRRWPDALVWFAVSALIRIVARLRIVDSDWAGSGRRRRRTAASG